MNLWSKTPIRRTVPIVFIVLAIPVLVTLHYNDDIRQMQAMPESLKQQESFISNLSGLESSQQMLVVTAKDDESLLQHLEKLNNQIRQVGTKRYHKWLSKPFAIYWIETTTKQRLSNDRATLLEPR
ncbi:membrane protein [Vibrio ishigakensis]|uniref:Membrane protein n=1 Tax=Vibrio ishigakensis TaxID=1481914 RepID=A0A0B8QM30_9VIBR|nr:membrane protein [Vibrio ishigakensis]